MSISDDEELTAEIDRHVQMARAIKPHTLDRMALADLLRHRFPHRTAGDIEEQLIVAWQKHDLFWTSGSGRPARIKKADEKNRTKARPAWLVAQAAVPGLDLTWVSALL